MNNLECRELAGGLGAYLSDNIEKGITALISPNSHKSDTYDFEVLDSSSNTSEVLLCSGNVNRNGDVIFDRKSSSLPLSETTALTPCQITKTKLRTKKYLSATIVEIYNKKQVNDEKIRTQGKVQKSKKRIGTQNIDK